jgi:hypothetical protein
VTGTEWLFRYPQNKRNNGRRNGKHTVADGTLKAKNNYFFAIGIVFSLYREPLMGDPIFPAKFE